MLVSGMERLFVQGEAAARPLAGRKLCKCRATNRRRVEIECRPIARGMGKRRNRTFTNKRGIRYRKEGGEVCPEFRVSQKQDKIQNEKKRK
jgi:hypothetical protein